MALAAVFCTVLALTWLPAMAFEAVAHSQSTSKQLYHPGWVRVGQTNALHWDPTVPSKSLVPGLVSSAASIHGEVVKGGLIPQELWGTKGEPTT